MVELFKKKERTILNIIFVIYFGFNDYMLNGHELWRDEANVWLLARDASPLELLSQIKYQGHPCLWYFLAMPFAKLGLPFTTLSVMSFVVMMITAGFFVYKMPLHPVTKFICLMSPIFSYYYSVVARNYCLIALILMLLAYLYPKRNEKPLVYGLLLGLAIQADTIAIAPAGLISAMWLWENAGKSMKQKEGSAILNAAKGLWLPLASLAFWGFQFAGVAGSSEFRWGDYSLSELLQEMKHFSFHILTRMTGQEQGFALLLMVLVILTGIGIFLKTKNGWPLIVMAGSFLFQAFFSVMVYQLHIWHYISLAFVLLWMIWFGRQEAWTNWSDIPMLGKWKLPALKEVHKKRIAAATRLIAEVLLITVSITMFLRWNSPEESSSLANALSGSYSDGGTTASYIKARIQPEELILSTNVTEAGTVQAYLGRNYRFYYAGTLEPETYSNYNDDQKVTITYAELEARLRDKFPEFSEGYLLMSPANCITDIPQEIWQDWEICYETMGETARGEEYTLYRIRW